MVIRKIKAKITTGTDENVINLESFDNVMPIFK